MQTLNKKNNKTKKLKHKYKHKICKITTIPSYDKDIKALISIDSIKNNLEYLKIKSGTDIMPVLKADAYGHGLLEVAKILRHLKVKYIGVATLGEAILLRKNGDNGRILSWLYNIDGKELLDGINLDLDIAIFDEKHISKIKKVVPNGKKLKITMFVDTGINRSGIPYNNAIQAFKDIVGCDKFELVGMMSHLICSEIKNSPLVNNQLNKFRILRKKLQEINIIPPLVHIANTDACINYDVSDFTLSRSGSGIYGLTSINLHSIKKELHLAMTLKTYIIQLKNIQKGEGIGYNWKFITNKNIRVAILPIGYADILPYNTSLKLNVYINGNKRKVLGSISMDQIIVLAKKNDKINDEVIIFGNGLNCPQTIYDIANISNTNPLEILCRTGYRINRIYI